jgi:hypothetical protein
MNLSDLKIEHKLINDALIKDRANKDHFLQELDDVQKNIQDYEDSKKTSVPSLLSVSTLTNDLPPAQLVSFLFLTF